MTDDNGMPLKGPGGGIIVMDKELEQKANQESVREARELRRGNVLFWMIVGALQIVAYFVARSHAYKLGRKFRIATTAFGGLSAGAFVSAIIFGSLWLFVVAALAAAWGALDIHRRLELYLANAVRQPN